MTSSTHWRLLVRGLKTHWRSCVWCGSVSIRRSRQRTPLVPRLLGLISCRCESCGRGFLVPKRVADQLWNRIADPAHVMIRPSG